MTLVPYLVKLVFTTQMGMLIYRTREQGPLVQFSSCRISFQELASHWDRTHSSISADIYFRNSNVEKQSVAIVWPLGMETLECADRCPVCQIKVETALHTIQSVSVPSCLSGLPYIFDFV